MVQENQLNEVFGDEFFVPALTCLLDGARVRWRALERERKMAHVRASVGDWDMHTYSFDSYFKNIGIQTMNDSSFERETHHASSDKKL